ncbi:mitochondrial substrate carrier family protein B-like protein [Tanacetum coccineum]
MEAQVDSGTAVKFLQTQQQQPVTVAQAPRQQQQSVEIGTVQQLLAGGIAGAFSKTCTAPLARMTILFQEEINFMGLSHEQPCEAEMPNWTIFYQFASQVRAFCSIFFGKDYKVLRKVQGMHSDVAMLSKPCIWNEARRIANEEGFRAFWKGNLVTIAHRLPYTAVNFYAYEQYKKLLKSIPSIGDNSGTAATDACVHFVGGGMSGITAATATYPLDLIRTRLAAQNLQLAEGTAITLVYLLQRSTMYYNGIGHAIRTICRDEGFFGLYKGLGATLLGVGPSIAISFSVYETLRSHWKAYRPDDPTVCVSLTCGSLSGIASSTATFPLDLVRRRKQLEGVGGQARVYNSGLLGTLGHIMRKEGLRGLYRGILPEYYKVVPGVGIVFMTYETLKKFLSDSSF